MKKLVIDVTQECIDSGIRDDGYECPIALAARHAGLLDPLVLSMIYVSSGTAVLTIPMTAEAMAFIRAFDQGMEVEPFSFEIRV